MKQFMKISLVVLVAAMLLSSCVFERNALIGSWKEETQGLVLQFKEDGKVVQSSPDQSGSAVEIGYQFLNDNTINILGTQNIYTFSVQGNTLTLSNQGQAITLTRVK